MALNFIETEGVNDYDAEISYNNNIDKHNGDDDEAAHAKENECLPLHYSTPTERDNLFYEQLNNSIISCPVR